MRISDWSSDVCSSDLLPSLPPVSCWPARSLMQAVDAFVHAMTTLWERLQPRGLGISIPKKLAAEAAPTGLPQGSSLHGLRRSGAAAERGVGDVARERAAACAQRAVGVRRQPGVRTEERRGGKEVVRTG